MEHYELQERLGEGTFGTVYSANRLKTGETVAIKMIKRGKFKDGVEFTALREIKLQNELHHENVVALLDVFNHNDQVCMVFEYLGTDLEKILRSPEIVLTAGDIKSYMKMILQGIHYLEENWILHRDLKPANLLQDSAGNLKLADFGLSRTFGSPNRNLTDKVVTLWYRAPELLFGAREYGAAVDVWAAGCVFAELMLRRGFFEGRDELDQLSRIFQVLGTPQEQDWPGLTSLPQYVEFNSCPGTPLKQIFSAASDDALDLLSKMFVYDPLKRISAREALDHPYFSSNPPPTSPSKLPQLANKKKDNGK